MGASKKIYLPASSTELLSCDIYNGYKVEVQYGSRVIKHVGIIKKGDFWQVDLAVGGTIHINPFHVITYKAVQIAKIVFYVYGHPAYEDVTYVTEYRTFDCSDVIDCIEQYGTSDGARFEYKKH